MLNICISRDNVVRPVGDMILETTGHLSKNIGTCMNANSLFHCTF